MSPLSEIGGLSALSHDLRTPLTSIIGFTELLADGSAGPVTTEQRRLLDAISRNAARIAAMIDDLSPGPGPRG